MLNKFHEKQQGMELIILEQLVPQDHLLRKIDRSIDFSFIRRLCAPLYSANLGRPAIEPEVLFRMLFVGYLYGIRSERRLEEEVNYNMAYKWFCGLNLTEKAPDATTAKYPPSTKRSTYTRIIIRSFIKDSNFFPGIQFCKPRARRIGNLSKIGVVIGTVALNNCRRGTIGDIDLFR